MFVNQKAQELNFKVAYLSAGGPNASDLVVHLHQTGDNTGALRTTTVKNLEAKLFGYVPSNLGRIRDFAIRLHVFGLDAPSQEAQLDPIVAGSNAVVLVAQDGAGLDAIAKRTQEAVERLYGKTWAPPLIALLQGAPAEAPSGFDAVTEYEPSTQKGSFESLKAAIKACLLRMKQGTEAPKSDEPLAPVVAVNLADVLRRMEKSKGAPLTEEEVLAVRNEVPFIMLPREKADEFVAQWQGDYINPASPWNAWQALKASQS